jgi:hypothetical protein
MDSNKWSLRQLYRTLETPGKNPLRDIQNRLDAAVRETYGMPPKADPLTFLLALNAELAQREKAGEPVTAPGLPPGVTDEAAFITDDCIKPPPL